MLQEYPMLYHFAKIVIRSSVCLSITLHVDWLLQVTYVLLAAPMLWLIISFENKEGGQAMCVFMLLE